MQSWMGERMAEEHRRHLATLRTRDRTPANLANVASPAKSVNPAHLALPSGPEQAGPQWSGPSRRVWHRTVGRQIGVLLIRAGTRLGGASIRPS
jgi:hypothetical protein